MIGVTSLLFPAILGICLAANWDYSNHGIDWKGNECEFKNKRILQSPINIEIPKCQCNDKMSLDFDFIEEIALRANLTMTGSPATPRILFDSPFAHLSLKLGNSRKVYKANGLVFRTPSEHRIDSTQFPLELQIHFQSPSDELLGLSFLFDYSARNLTNVIFDDFLNNLCRANIIANNSVSLPNFVNYNKVLPTKLDFYQYNGTMTDTDCSRDVTWIVLQQTFYVSKKSVNEFQSLLQKTTGSDHNARLLQPIGPRVVYKSRDNCGYRLRDVFWLAMGNIGVAYFAAKML
jgi:carbonic anhydrase